MKQYGLRSIVAMRMVALVLATVALISLLANLLIGREFHTYVDGEEVLNNFSFNELREFI